jgi:hypothetical protein
LQGADVGASLAIDSASDLCSTLELLIPEVLRSEHPEWNTESIDGFFFSSAVKTDDGMAELTGTCILISDQTVTPFALDVGLSDVGTFRSFRIRLGEPGTGPLGISGPPCNSSAAQTMLAVLSDRLERVAWTYDVSV